MEPDVLHPLLKKYVTLGRHWSATLALQWSSLSENYVGCSLGRCPCKTAPSELQ